MDYFTHVAALAAGAVLVVQQILKLKVIPMSFANKWPVLTNIALSIVAALVVNWQTAVELVAWTDWVVFIGTVSVVAAIAYNMTIRNEPVIKGLEG